MTLLQHLANCEAVETEKTKFGVESELPAPSSETTIVLSVWIISEVEDFPRLTSAYPQKGDNYDLRIRDD